MKEDVAQRAAPSKPGLLTQLAFGIGGAAGGMKNNGFEYVLLLFYSQIIGLPAVWVATALAIALVFDAVSDPAVGYWSDNLRTRFGRRHPLMYAAILPVALGYFFIWNPPAEASNTVLFAWLLTFVIFVRLSFTLYEVPSIALSAELSSDYDTRTTLIAYRTFFGWFAGLTLQIILFAVLLQATEADRSGFSYLPGWNAYGLVAACAIMATMAITALGTHHRIPHLPAPPPKRERKLSDMFAEIWETLSNPSFRMLFLSTMVGFFAGGLSAALNQYINGFFWGFTNEQIAGLTLPVYLSAGLALAIAPIAGRVFGKKIAAIVIGILAFTIAPAPVIARQFGLLPANGTEELYVIIVAVTVIDVALIISYQILAISMVTDIVEESELNTGRRSEGLLFSGLSFIRKLAQGVGVVMASFILAVAAITPQTLPDQVSEASLRALGWGYALALLSLWTLMLVCICFYRISRDDHKDNLAKLAART
ncbi:MAG: MFS transporter [Pseudomonadota bacterium]